jgi:hypothetical protein
MKVYSFEPSVFNLEILSRNVHINALENHVIIVPISLGPVTTVGKFNLTSIDWGGALSTFGSEIGFDGKKMNKIFIDYLLIKKKIINQTSILLR